MTEQVIFGEEEMDAMRNELYHERALLLSVLTLHYPSIIGTDTKEPDWPVLYVSTPAGQISWHIAANDLELFKHVNRTSNAKWDGHTKAEAMDRLKSVVKLMVPTLYMA